MPVARFSNQPLPAKGVDSTAASGGILKRCGDKGLGLLELLVVIAIISFALTALVGLGNYALRISSDLKQNIIAANLASEAIEAVKAMKNESWNNLSSLNLETPYYPAQSGQKWIAAPGAETINGLTRQFVLSRVFRDTNDDIAPNGNLDSETKKIITTVSWIEKGESKQISLTAYLANWKP